MCQPQHPTPSLLTPRRPWAQLRGWTTSGGERDSFSVVPAVEAEQDEPADRGEQRLGQVEDEQLLLEVLPEEAEAELHGGGSA